jgi:hypothetical protein
VTPSVIDRVAAELPKAFPGKLFDAIATNLQMAAERLAAMPST